MCDASFGPIIKVTLTFTISQLQRLLLPVVTTITDLLVLLSSFTKFYLGAKLFLGKMLGRSRKEMCGFFLTLKPFIISP